MPSEDILTKRPPAAEMRFVYGDDPNQFLDVRLPAGKGPHPVVFFIHGGYWRAKYDLTYAGHFCHALQQAGIATWNVEYRRAGQTGGGWPGTFEDIRSAFRALNKSNENTEKLDLTRVCVAGHSAGGQLALCLAAYDNSIQRVISLAGVLDLRRAWELRLSNDAAGEFLGGSPEQVPERYRQASPAEQPIQAIQKLVHGTADKDVPCEISRGYAERKRQSGEAVELLTFRDIGHFEIVDPESVVWCKVLEVFTALMR